MDSINILMNYLASISTLAGIEITPRTKATKILSTVEELEETVDSTMQELQKISGQLSQTKRELKEIRNAEDKLLSKEQVCLKAQQTVNCCEMILDLSS